MLERNHISGTKIVKNQEKSGYVATHVGLKMVFVLCGIVDAVIIPSDDKDNEFDLDLI